MSGATPRGTSPEFSPGVLSARLLEPQRESLSSAALRESIAYELFLLFDAASFLMAAAVLWLFWSWAAPLALVYGLLWLPYVRSWRHRIAHDSCCLGFPDVARSQWRTLFLRSSTAASVLVAAVNITENLLPGLLPGLLPELSALLWGGHVAMSLGFHWSVRAVLHIPLARSRDALERCVEALLLAFLIYFPCRWLETLRPVATVVFGATAVCIGLSWVAAFLQACQTAPEDLAVFPLVKKYGLLTDIRLALRHTVSFKYRGFALPASVLSALDTAQLASIETPRDGPEIVSETAFLDMLGDSGDLLWAYVSGEFARERLADDLPEQAPLAPPPAEPIAETRRRQVVRPVAKAAWRRPRPPQQAPKPNSPRSAEQEEAGRSASGSAAGSVSNFEALARQAYEQQTRFQKNYDRSRVAGSWGRAHGGGSPGFRR